MYREDFESSWKIKKFYHHEGFCIAAIISYLMDNTKQQMSQQKQSTESDSHQRKQQRIDEHTSNNEN
jgi:hypothetical protein